VSCAKRDAVADGKIFKISTGFELVLTFTLEAEITRKWLRRRGRTGMLIPQYERGQRNVSEFLGVPLEDRWIILQLELFDGLEVRCSHHVTPSA
jgi:hypothetical protein